MKNLLRRIWFDFGIWLDGYKYFLVATKGKQRAVGFFTSEKVANQFLKMNTEVETRSGASMESFYVNLSDKNKQ